MGDLLHLLLLCAFAALRDIPSPFLGSKLTSTVALSPGGSVVTPSTTALAKGGPGGPSPAVGLKY
jgi:hypothetical protein